MNAWTERDDELLKRYERSHDAQFTVLKCRYDAAGAELRKTRLGRLAWKIVGRSLRLSVPREMGGITKSLQR